MASNEVEEPLGNPWKSCGVLNSPPDVNSISWGIDLDFNQPVAAGKDAPIGDSKNGYATQFDYFNVLTSLVPHTQLGDQGLSLLATDALTIMPKTTACILRPSLAKPIQVFRSLHVSTVMEASWIFSRSWNGRLTEWLEIIPLPRFQLTDGDISETSMDNPAQRDGPAESFRESYRMSSEVPVPECSPRESRHHRFWTPSAEIYPWAAEEDT